MEISKRLKCIANMIENCDVVADIGTDHGYLPIYLIKEGKCKKAIASDINEGPIKKAKFNINFEGMEKLIQCRLGAGFSSIKPNEADVGVIAGMGGNLIKDIIEDGIEVFKKFDYLILQPVQNPEVIRKHLVEKGYEIIDEELCIYENKYYEIIKVKYKNRKNVEEDIFYEISPLLLKKKHPLIKEYICIKIQKYDKILNSIIDQGFLAQNRKVLLGKKIEKLEEMLKCL